MTFVAPNLACGKTRGGSISRSGSVTDEQRRHRPNSAQPEGRPFFFGQTSLLAPYRSTAGYARRSRLVWPKNPWPRTSPYLWIGVLRSSYAVETTNEHESTRIYAGQNTVAERPHHSRFGDRSRRWLRTIPSRYSLVFIRVYSWLRGIFPAQRCPGICRLCGKALVTVGRLKFHPTKFSTEFPTKEMREVAPRYSDFGPRHSFVFRHSSFVI